MKKIILYLCLAAGLVSCAKELTPAIEDDPAGVPVTFNITVSDGPETKASKTAWVENDAIYVFFKGLEAKYLKLTYNGSTWDSTSTIEDTDLAGLTDRTLTAVHIPAPVDVVFDEGEFSFFVGNQRYSNYYLSESEKDYTLDEATVTASLTLGKPEGMAMFHIPGIQNHVSGYTFSCPLVAKISCSVSSDGTIITLGYNKPAGGEDLYGIADADGVIFAGELLTDEAADFTFTLESRTKTYALTRSNKTLVPGKMYNFPALTADDWIVTNNVEMQYVEMGDGLRWGTMNLGAISPEDYGEYFAWGETESKDTFDWSNYKFMQAGQSNAQYITKYQQEDNYAIAIWYHNYTEFVGDGFTSFADCDYVDDAARVQLGSTWRIPSKAEWGVLMDNDKFTWEWFDDYEDTGVAGYVVTSKIEGYAGNSIFLPAAGILSEGQSDFVGQGGYYWASDISNPSWRAASLNFGSRTYNPASSSRGNGLSIRAVMSDPTNGHDYVDMGNGLKWATMNIGATTPEEIGDYFAWGETSTKTGDYDWSTYLYRNTELDPGNSNITKYTYADDYKEAIWYDGDTFIGDGKTSFADYDYADDPARQAWGGTWRTPTGTELKWLAENCTYTEALDYNGSGVNGMILTSTVEGYEGNQLFLPFGGQKQVALTVNYGYDGCYWSSSLGTFSSYSAVYLSVGYHPNSYATMRTNFMDRYDGLLIRAVSD